MVLELSRSRSVVRRARVQAFAQKLAPVLGSLVRTAKKKQGLWARPPVADACAITGRPQPRVFEIHITLTFRALRRNHLESTLFEAFAKE